MFCPIIWCYAIHYFNSLDSDLNKQITEVGATHDLPTVPRCYGDDCITIGYSIVGEYDPENSHQYQWIDDIMGSVAGDQRLQFDKDVKRLTVGTAGDFLEYQEMNPNVTLYSVVWCTS